MRIVCIAGFFDPIHEGHLKYIQAARQLGEYLIAITHPDEIIDQFKRVHLLPLKTRIALLEALGIDKVVVSIDTDGTVTKTLMELGPQIFAKDGDRDISTLPQCEIDVCSAIGCEIVYLGNPKDNSSSNIKDDFLNRWVNSDEVARVIRMGIFKGMKDHFPT